MNEDAYPYDAPPIQRAIGIMFIVGGLWHAAAPWIFRYSGNHVALASNIAAGLALLVVGICYLVFRGGLVLDWLAGLIGTWVLIAPSVLALGGPSVEGLEGSWGGPMVIALAVVAALDRWFARSVRTQPAGPAPGPTPA